MNKILENFRYRIIPFANYKRRTALIKGYPIKASSIGCRIAKFAPMVIWAKLNSNFSYKHLYCQTKSRKNTIIKTFRKVVISVLIIFNILPLGIFSWQPKSVEVMAADAVTISKSSQSDWAAGKFEYNEVDVNGSPGDIKLQLDLGTWDASGPASINNYIYSNTKLIKVNRYLYLFRNRYLGQFLRYDLDSKEWKEMAYLPIEPYEVVDATTNGVDKIYAFATRTGRQHFLTYDIPTNTWTLGEAGNILGAGATLEYVSGATDYIYAFRGNDSTDFWRYNFNTWGSLTNSTARCTNYCDLLYDGTKYLYAMIDYGTDRLYRLDTTVTTPTWVGVGAGLPDGSSNYPSDMVMVGSNIYMLKGNGTKTFYKYDGANWTTKADLPYVTTYGSITYDNDNGANRIIAYTDIGTLLYYYVDTDTWSQGSMGPTLNSYNGSQTFTSDNAGNYYICRAQGTAVCYKYNGSNWTTITFATGALGDGTVMAYMNNYLYVGMGGSTNWRQVTPATGASANLTATSNAFGAGSSIAASDAASLFVVHGGSTVFRKYTGTTWTTLAAFPETAGRGTSLAKLGPYIYAVLGNNRGRVFRYAETPNSWEEVASLPVGVYSGGQMISDNSRYLYIQAGGDNDLTARQFYRYDSQEGTWQRIADTPNIVRYGGGLATNTTNGDIYSYQGYSGGFWKYSQPTKTYVSLGEWYSPIYDLGSVSSFESFTSTDTPAAGVENSILYYSRTSDDQVKWDEWEPFTTNIASIPRKYIQIRIKLTGDSGGTVTPTVSSFSFNYYKDISGPTVTGLNLKAYSATGGATLVSENTYSHRNPYFEWNPAIDSESGVDGYNVYFGTETNPVTGWEFQRTTNYIVNTGMASGSTYHFIVKAKDREGNLSDPVSFEYVYNGISPTRTKTITNQSDWDNNEATKSAVYTSSVDWWNQSYLYRKQLSITAAANLDPGYLAKTTEDSSALETAGKVRADRKDWRIVYKDGTFWREINRQYVSPSLTYFPLQKGINNGSTDTNYYIYYGNINEDADPLSIISDSRAVSKFGQALSFDGGDYVRIPTMHTALNGLSSLTIEGWFRYINANGIRSLYGGNTAQQTAINIPSGANYLQYQVRTSASGTAYSNNGTGFLLPNTWNHFALTYDQSTGIARGYLNGRLDFERTSLAGTIVASATQYIGYNSTNGGYMYGFLDEFRISNSVRYPGNFTPRPTPFTSDDDTLGLYHLDDGTGQTVLDSSTVVVRNGELGATSGVDAATDPTWMTAATFSSGVEENAGATADTSLTLEPMTGGSWGGYQLSSLPWGSRLMYGAAAHANNSVYVLRGYNTTTFFKLDLSTGLWSQLADTPAATYYSAMAYDGNDTIYALQGNGTTNFYKYTISTNTWSSPAGQPSLLFTIGSAMTIGKDKDGNDVLFVARGGGSSDFAIYYINGENADSWSVKVSPTAFTFYYGSGLAYDPAGYVWAVGGYDSFGFGKYKLEDGSWDNTVIAPPNIPYLIGRSSNNLVLYGNYLYTTTNFDFQANNESKNYIWRFNKTTNKWENVQTATENWNYYGVTAYDGSRYAYIINGESAGQTSIARYDFQENKYSPETPILPQDRTYTNDNERVSHAVSTGTALASDGVDNVYMAQGGTSYVNRYQISTKRWTQIPNVPCTFYGGMVHTGTSLYLVCGNDTKKMYKYDEINKYWLMMKDSEEADGISGAGNQIMAYDGNDSIYVLKGRNTQKIYKYTISTNDWDNSVISTIPAAVGTASINNSLGASIQYYKNGSDEYLYVLRGNGNTTFYRYNINTPGWTTLTSIPEPVYTGSSSFILDNKIYVTSGFFTNTLYIYDIATASWSYGTDAMSPIQAGGAMTKGPGDTAYVLQGGGMYTFWKYNIPSSDSSYKFTGSYISNPVDLESIFSFVGLKATVASPSATSVSFDTRTSTDSASWSLWLSATNLKPIDSTQYTYTINSPAQRYVQVRATLTSDESAETPIISDIAFEYYSDITAPNLPDTLGAYETATKAADQILENYRWHNKSSPYFEWSGGSDGTGGSGIAGYYVYFGNDKDANASISGSLQTTANYTASLATNGTDDGEYYLRIQAVDNAGNISTSNWSPFHYRYDHTAPAALGAVSVDPRIFTNTNSFDFSWTAIADQTSNSTSSGLLGYKYQATSSAVLESDLPTIETTVSDIEAYDEGSANTFWVKAEDIAGNVTSYRTASFYYNAVAPSAPTELGVDTSEAGANVFAFTWAKPNTIKGAVKEYRYAINPVDDILNDNNISTTAATLITNQKGTKTGTNNFYVVAVDEAGNVDYSNYATVPFDVSIAAPGIPLNPEVFDNSIRSTESYKVGLTWDKPTDMGSAFDRYEVWASTKMVECSTSMDDYALVGSTAGTSKGGSYVVTSMSNEDLESIDYNFCVLACSSNNQCSGPSTTLSMLPSGRWLTAPDLTVSPSSVVKTKSAIVSWSTGRAGNSFVKYGTASGNYGNEVGSSDSVFSHSISVTGLTPGTKYYYKVLWTDEDGNQGASDEYNFTTNAAPLVSSVKASDISLYSAYIKFTVRSATKVNIEYGKTISYGSVSSLTTGTAENTNTVKLDTLTEGTVYHFRIVAEDEEGNKFLGDDYTFQTLPVPKIQAARVQQVTNMPTATLRLLWTTNTPVSSIVTYYPDSSPEGAKDQIVLAMTTSHEMVIRNLKDDAMYSLVIKGKDIAGNETAESIQKIRTATDLRPPEIQNMNVESTIVGVGAEAKAQIIVSWDTDEPASSQVEFAQGTGANYGQSTQEDPALTQNHVVTITGLTPSKIYHLRAISKDKSGNIGQSFDTVVITPKSTQDALNLVVDNLSKTFKFLKGYGK